MRLFFLLSILCFSCTKETELSYYQEYDSGTKDIIYYIDRNESRKVTCIAGYVWNRALSISIEPNHLAFASTIDTFSNKGQMGFLRTDDGTFLTVGTDGYLYTKKDSDQKWVFHRLENWDILNDIILSENGYIAAGGKSYEQGYLYHINTEYHIDTALYFGHEISQIIRISHQKYLTLGWGNIQYSEDGGYTWTLLPNEGDFYASGLFLDENNGFIIGYNGSILQSNDGGKRWTNANVNISGNGFNSFRKLKKIDENLMILGNNGQLWKSTDEGKNWSYYKLSTDSDFFDIVRLDNGRYLCVGSEGLMAEIGF